MSKKHFIALADMIRAHNTAVKKFQGHGYLIIPRPFDNGHLAALADFLQSQNPRFNRERWLGYIAGENGPNGGKI